MSNNVESSSVELLGEFRISIHGRPVTNWRAGRSRALVQYLLVHRNRPVSRDTLREALWPHLPPSAGATSVKAAVHGARRALGEAADRPAPLQICSVDGGYLLRTDQLWIDMAAFDRLVRAATAAAASGDHEGAAGHFRHAVAIYRGPLLPNQDAEWVVTEREWLRTQALHALRFLSDRALGADDPWTAIHWSRRALDVDPYDQATFAVMADCHRRLGLGAQARRWDDLAANRLAEV
ncbi:BTAD domain-containing putative transcriptional regulator [Micromonospora sp. KC213]|uniref:AfsR/SARP family transcriptional regulator n=1 Tax=Micromonospora sp. KC213 TaxID=2530378 RepID=UPI001052345B|nr:BTAD domain-containing putative transcriptional regulator [Micromonospora sp. KC213]TDC42159.1 SARP family transcriptional regulator [Micromonospora sp. KC213]